MTEKEQAAVYVRFQQWVARVQQSRITHGRLSSGAAWVKLEWVNGAGATCALETVAENHAEALGKLLDSPGLRQVCFRCAEPALEGGYCERHARQW